MSNMIISLVIKARVCKPVLLNAPKLSIMVELLSACKNIRHRVLAKSKNSPAPTYLEKFFTERSL